MPSVSTSYAASRHDGPPPALLPGKAGDEVSGLGAGPLATALGELFPLVDDIFTCPESDGYWSNLSPDGQEDLLEAVRTTDRPLESIVREKLPGLANYVYAGDRANGLSLLDIEQDEVGIDYGCMWGNLLIEAARRSRAVVGVDKTREHLQFLKARLREERIDNAFLVQRDLRSGLDLPGRFDFAIVNGVLEWIPSSDEIALDVYHDRGRTARLKQPSGDPAEAQKSFLEMVHRNLAPNGRLYLAIENRVDYQLFLWKRDPHTGTFATAWLPRSWANTVYNLTHGRPYVTYIHSPGGLARLLREAGFSDVALYAAFPSYRHPKVVERIPSRGRKNLEGIYNEKSTRNPIKRMFRRARHASDVLLFNSLHLWRLAPSLIAVAGK